MAMYALAILPLIHKLKNISPDVKQVRYADDATGAGTCEGLRQWRKHVELLVLPISGHAHIHGSKDLDLFHQHLRLHQCSSALKYGSNPEQGS